MLTFLILYSYLRDCVDSIRGHGRPDRRGQLIMAAKTLLQDYLTWMKDEQRLHETDRHEHNYRSLHDAVSEQRRRVKLVRELTDEIHDASNVQQEEANSTLLATSYRDLSFLSEKRLECLLDVYKLSTLEEKFNSLSVSADRMAVQLVEDRDHKSPDDRLVIPEGKASVKAIQECILLVQSNWAWMNQLMSCLNTHMENAAKYHQFFYEAGEVERLMTSQLQELSKLFRTARAVDGIGDAKRLNEELKELMNTMTYWQGRIGDLYTRSDGLVPVHLRTQPLNNHIELTALCSYQTKEITIKEGDKLKLLDNSFPKAWRVCNIQGQEADVPPIICMLPDSDKKAKSHVIRLQLQLLDAFTESVQLTGKRLILFLSLVFWQNAEDEIHVLQKLDSADKRTLLSACAFLEDTLAQYWSGYHGYEKLKTMLDSLRRSIEKTSTSWLSSEDKEASKQVLASTKCVEEMVKSYKVFWVFWELYRSKIEESEDPIYVELLESWNREKVIRMPRYSEGELDVEKLIRLRSNPAESHILPEEVEEEIKEETSANESQKPNGNVQWNVAMDDLPDDELDFELVPEIAQEVCAPTEDSELFQQNDVPVQGLDNGVHTIDVPNGIYRINIGGAEKLVQVVGIQDSLGNILSLHDAVESGIFKAEEGLYQRNPESPQSSLIEAIFENKVNVENIPVDESDLSRQAKPFFAVVQPHIAGLQGGIFKTDVRGERKMFSIENMADGDTLKAIDIDMALKEGLLNLQNGTCKMPSTYGTKMKWLSHAIADGDLTVKYIDENEKCDNIWGRFSTITCDNNNRIICKLVGGEQCVFYIDSVLDTKNAKLLTCTDAITQHVVDFISFLFMDTETAECMSIPEAISKGYINVSLKERLCGCDFKIVGGSMADKNCIYSARFDNAVRYFRIKRVVDPITKQHMSSQEAGHLIDLKKGVYVNPESNERLTISYAIEIGLVIVEYLDFDNNDVDVDIRFVAMDPEGPIFSSIIKGESKLFKIKEIKCTKTDRIFTLQDAIKFGLFDPFTGYYIELRKNTKIPLETCLSDDLVKIEIIESIEKVVALNDFVKLNSKLFNSYSATIDGEKKSFMIDTVYSTVNKKKLSTVQAIADHIIDVPCGMYVDRMSGEILTISQAIGRSRICATYIADSVSSIHSNGNVHYIVPLSRDGVFKLVDEDKNMIFSIRKVYDVESDEMISFDEGKDRCIVNVPAGSYSLGPHGVISIPTAINNNLIEITEHESGMDIVNTIPEYTLIDETNYCYVYRSSQSTDPETVILTSVYDPVLGETIPVSVAVKQRLFDIRSGKYIVPKTRQTFSFGQALLLQLIIVRNISYVPSNDCCPASDIDQSNSYQCVNKTFPFMVDGKLVWCLIDSVYDSVRDVNMPPDEAEKSGVLNMSKRTVSNKKTNESFNFENAMRTGLINIRTVPQPIFHKENKSGFKIGKSMEKPLLCSATVFKGDEITFLIDAIVDDSSYVQMSLSEAINQGIFNPLTGEYIKLSTGDSISFSEAVSKNYIQLDFRDEKEVEMTSPNGHPEVVEDVINPQSVRVDESAPTSSDTIDGRKEHTDTIEIIGFENDSPILKSLKGSQYSYFVLGSIIDTSSGKPIPIHEAIANGIIDLDLGTYFDSKSGRAIPLNEAEKLGYLRTAPVTQPDSNTNSHTASDISCTKASNRNDNTYTIGSDEKKQSFNITHVVDPDTKQQISINEAIAKGIFDPETGLYTNPRTGRKIRIDIALKLQLISVKYVEAPRNRSESVQQAQENAPAIQFYTAPIDGVKRTFIIKGVRDLKSANIVSMAEAAERGIVEKSKGQYVNNSSGERVSILKAITKGWITVEFIEKDSILGDITKCKRLNIITSSDESILTVTNSDDEDKSYVITGVVNPKDDKTISVAEAMSLGVVETRTGRYCNIKTGESLPIVVAVSKGLIVVEAKTEQQMKAEERKSPERQFSATKESADVETEQHVTTVQEESTTFTITGVVNPRTKEVISLYDALQIGVIDDRDGVYANNVTGERFPIPVAINMGLIQVAYSKTKKTKEETVSVGVITIETTKEKQSYIVTSVMDAGKGLLLTVDEAIGQGIFDETTGIYKNTKTNEELSLMDAIEQDFVIGEYDTAEPGNEVEPEIITQTFSVTGVFDHRQGRAISFHDAVQCGLLDGESGTYLNNVTEERMFLGDAITNGLIIATLVEDPSSLDIKPENKLVCGRDRVATIRKKLINPLKAINAMRSGKK